MRKFNNAYIFGISMVSALPVPSMVPVMVGLLTLVMPSLWDDPLSVAVVRPVVATVGAVVSITRL